MRLRALDLETTDTLLGMLARGLSEISNRLAALAPEASLELGDALGDAAVALDRHVAIVEVVQSRLSNSERKTNERHREEEARQLYGAVRGHRPLRGFCQ
jgi:hypothetical protein